MEGVSEKVLSRARGLLGMQQSPNLEEASVAAAMLSSLMAKHNLDMAEISVSAIKNGQATADQAYEKEMVTLSSKVNWRRELLFVVAVSNFCTAITYPATSNMLLIGQKDNRAFVRELDALLSVQLERMADNEFNQYRIKAGRYAIHGRKWKSSFFTGAINTIHARLKREKQIVVNEHPNGNALMVMKDNALEDAVNELLGKTKETKTKKNIDPFAYAAGAAAANNLDLKNRAGYIGNNMLALNG